MWARCVHRTLQLTLCAAQARGKDTTSDVLFRQACSENQHSSSGAKLAGRCVVMNSDPSQLAAYILSTVLLVQTRVGVHCAAVYMQKHSADSVWRLACKVMGLKGGLHRLLGCYSILMLIR